MTLLTFKHALQFLTRIPVRISAFEPDDFSRSVNWFPVVGLIVGALLAGALWAGGLVSPWLGALFALAVWVWVTGGLHLDGLADVADGLGAAHRAPERFLEVLRDPHIGAFGTMAIVLQLIAKLVLLAEIAPHGLLSALVLVPAWARLGPLFWGLTVPPYAKGTGERFSWRIDPQAVAVAALLLGAVSLWVAPILLSALILIPLISLYWRARLGGMTGDCLGASVEVTETGLLVLLALASG